MNRDALSLALDCFSVGNRALLAGRFDEAVLAYSDGLVHRPESTGLLLNRSIAFEKAGEISSAFEDLCSYLLANRVNDTHATVADASEIKALKRFISLGIATNQVKRTLWVLQQLEVHTFWQTIDLYDLLLGLMLVDERVLELGLVHYTVRATQACCLSESSLIRICEFLLLHQEVVVATPSVQDVKSDTVENLLLQLAFLPEAPVFVLNTWLNQALPKISLESARIDKVSEILSLWLVNHELDEENAQLLISALVNQRQIDYAETIFLELAKRYPDNPFYVLGLVRTRFFKRDPRRAFVLINAILDNDKNNLEVRLERARIFQHVSSHQLALVDVNQNLEIEPDHIPSLILKLDLLTDIGSLDEALELYTQLSKRDLTQDERLGVGTALSFLYRVSGREQEWFAQVENLATNYPENSVVQCELGWKNIYLGNWQQGFAQLEHRFDETLHYFAMKPHLEKSMIPPWTPDAIQGPAQGKNLLLSTEEGLGDVLQFARFIPQLLARGLNITLICKDALHALLAFNFPSVVFKTNVQILKELGEGGAQRYDFYGELMSAPYILGLGIKDLKAEPYLRPVTEKVNEWSLRMPPSSADPRPYTLGLRWVSSLSRSARSVPLACFTELAALPIAMIGLHHGPIKDEDVTLYRQWPNFFPTELPIEDLAAVMMHLDCIVTCDTMTAHLAGALGRPTILLKPTFIDWRWVGEGTRSIWYDSMHIIRQDRFLDWSEAIKQLIQELHKRL